ncbi:MAG: AI-2E family transporter [Bacilli bacterium]|nr:AI-2E family transporter [Bacilli bacterium]
MFKKSKDKDIDITSLNQILKTGKRIINIGYFMAIIAVILLCTYLLKEWKILGYIGEFLKVISPIFIGFIIAWFFDPMVTWLQKKKIPRLVGCILVYLLMIGVLALIIYLLVPALISQVKDFVNAAPSIFNEITEFIVGVIKRFDLNGMINIKTVKTTLTTTVTEYGIRIGSEMPEYLFKLGKVIVSFGLNFVLGLMIGFYLLFDFERANKALYKIIPTSWKSGYKELTNRINTSLRSYVQGVLIVMTLVFITQSIGLTIAGMKAPILFALFCAVTDVIPYFGPYIGAIPAVIVGFTISPITGICVIISILVVQLLENNFYQPLIMGHTMKLHPVTIMVGLLVFEHFFGIIGMIIATPCIACIKVILLFILEETGWIKYLKGEKKKDNEIEVVELKKVKKK